jgi:hypothetical protein
MELYKLQQEKAALEGRLTAVLKGEIRKFMTEGGLHPVEINVSIIDANLFGYPVTPELVDVKVRFGL